MNLDQLRDERQKWYEWKNIKPLKEKLDNLKLDNKININIDDCVNIDIENFSSEQREFIYDFAKELRPWRKGPFKINDIFIDSEWQSFIKYNLIKKHFDLKDKVVGDIGCNNGYYMFRMLEDNPKKIIGFDPSILTKIQFDFINYFVKSDKITFELLGVEHCEFYEEKFDVLFCLGVLYHRSDPVNTLKSLAKSINKDGCLILDTFMIDGQLEVALTPNKKYSKIPNIYFVPTIPALKNWCLRAGFSDVEVLETSTTNFDEQRKTEWIYGESLEDFLDKDDPSKTVEGYPAPKRVYIKAIR
jgi:tRNA (mo5U34)-methyltransferase